MDQHLLRQLDELAGSQQWLVHRHQLTLLGFTKKQVFRLQGEERWRWVTPLVLGKVGAAESEDYQRRLALLDAGEGAVLSLGSAALFWGAHGFAEPPVNVLLPRFDKPRHDHVGVIHRSRALPPDHFSTVDGWRVTTPTRTVFDLAAVAHPKKVERTLDTFWAQRLVTADSLVRALEQLHKRGRAGITLMRQLIEDRNGADYRPPESDLERQFEELLRTSDLPWPERQVEIFDGDEFVARVDFLYRTKKVVVFVDSDRFHTAKLDRLKDLRQTAWLQRLGYTIVRVVERDLRFNRVAILDEIRAALGIQPPFWGGVVPA